MTRIIVITGWDRFQHYKDRDPPWVKLYRDILTSESWLLGTDASRLVQLASLLLAARYHNATPLIYEVFRRAAHLDITQEDFTSAITHLESYQFLEIQEDTTKRKPNASNVLATCTSEKSRAEKSREDKKVPTEPMSDTPTEADESPRETSDGIGEAVARVFRHWREVHNHPRAQLDAKRRKLIRAALLNYSEADLCLSISGYRNSPHHMGQNDRATVYDDIGLMLRDASHIDAGLRFGAEPPRTDLSAQTRRIIDQTADWTPPEMRRAAN